MLSSYLFLLFDVPRSDEMDVSKGSTKENIEIRFFLTPTGARKLLTKWKNEKRRLEPYSFVDHYFTRGKSRAKIRKWKSAHTPKIEIIFFKRKAGVKTESNKAATSLQTASKELEALGFKPYLKIVKERAWLVSKSGISTYALEFVPGLGWTGEIEVPVKDRKKIPNHVEHLKRMGATRVARKSMLQLMEQRLERKRLPVRCQLSRMKATSSSET